MSEIYRGVVERVKHCEFAIDLGANIGLTSLYLAAAYPQCKILAVEPDEGNQAILRQNLHSLTTARRCQILHGAVWGTDDVVELVGAPNGIDFDAIHVIPCESRNSGSPTVKAYTPSALMKLAGFPRVDILKMDIEGAEVELFRHDHSWLDRVNSITAEFHRDSRRESNFDQAAARHGFLVENDRFPNTVLAVRPTKEWLE